MTPDPKAQERRSLARALAAIKEAAADAALTAKTIRRPEHYERAGILEKRHALAARFLAEYDDAEAAIETQADPRVILHREAAKVAVSLRAILPGLTEEHAAALAKMFGPFDRLREQALAAGRGLSPVQVRDNAAREILRLAELTKREDAKLSKAP